MGPKLKGLVLISLLIASGFQLIFRKANFDCIDISENMKLRSQWFSGSSVALVTVKIHLKRRSFTQWQDLEAALPLLLPSCTLARLLSLTLSIPTSSSLVSVRHKAHQQV